MSNQIVADCGELLKIVPVVKFSSVTMDNGMTCLGKWKEVRHVTGSDEEVSCICCRCIDDDLLSNEVRESGSCNECAYCGEVGETWTLLALANRIHVALQEHFEFTSLNPDDHSDIMVRLGLTRWEREGEYVLHVISDMAGLAEATAADLTALLRKIHYSYPDEKEGALNPYGYDAFYKERAPDTDEFVNTWDSFRNEIQSRSRFFNERAKEALNEIFGDLYEHKTIDVGPVLWEVGPGDSAGFFWRARNAPSEEDLKVILKSPASEIGPPPSELARSGRMNPAGIPVFYGALDRSTCVSETRPSVGSYVVLGKFELLRKVILLDLDALGKIYVDVSHFDWKFSVRRARAAFLRHLVKEMSRPVMPQDEDAEYIATQTVAEYLANVVSPRLDGIVFRSSQTGAVGQNVVLFNHARGVERDTIPKGAEIEVYPPHDDEDGWEDPTFHVSRILPSELPKESTPKTEPREIPDALPTLCSDEYEPEGEEAQIICMEPTLKLDIESIVVLEIKAVEYMHECIPVSWSEMKKDDDPSSGYPWDWP